MSKKLPEMTLEELWKLFPIILTKHNDDWKNWYKEEYDQLIQILPSDVLINHIGSTAIKEIMAKPIIDILVEVKDKTTMEITKNTLNQNGYICMSESDKRISFNKGYTEKGFAEKVFHIHVRLLGDNEEISFRNYMNEHPIQRKKYEELKLSIFKKYEHDRDGYTEAKSEFIQNINKLIKNKY